MRWNVGTKIGAAFGLALVIVTALGVVAFRGTAQLIAAAESRRHTYDVLTQHDQILLALQDLEISQRNYLLTGSAPYLAAFEVALPQLDAHVGRLRSLLAGDPGMQSRLGEVEALARQRIAVARDTIDVYRSGGQAAAVARVREGLGQRLREQTLAVLKGMNDAEQRRLAERIDATVRQARLSQRTILVGTLLCAIVALMAGAGISRNIARPLGELTVNADSIARGNLDVAFAKSDRTDEVGELGRAFDRMAVSLRAMAAAATQIAAGDLRSDVTPQSDRDALGTAFAQMIHTLREQTRRTIEGASVIGSAASQIVASTTELASSAAQSAAAVTETTTTVEEVRQTAQVASQKAQHVYESARKAAQISQDGRKSAEDAGAGMERIRQQMDAIAASMVRLSEQSQTIGQIIATVEDLSGQSNLLAVNAAVEAAKAGEHGRGFNVVAQEVKSLAMQSRQATGEVRAILGDVQRATSAAVLATEQGTRAVEAGTRQTEVAGASINALAGSVQDAAQAATQIAASSQQQLVGVDQVATAMESIKQASAQNVSSSRQLEAAARNLSSLGQQLNQMVARYQL